MIIINCRIDNSKDLFPGKYAAAEIILESIESNALREEAIVQIEGKNYVLTLVPKVNENFKYLPVPIEIGMKHNGYVEVLDDKAIKNKDILVDGAYYLVN